MNQQKHWTKNTVSTLLLYPLHVFFERWPHVEQWLPFFEFPVIWYLMISDVHLSQPVLGNEEKWLHYLRDHVYAPSKWETMLQCNVVSHWLVAYSKWSLLSAGEDLDMNTPRLIRINSVVARGTLSSIRASKISPGQVVLGKVSIDILWTVCSKMQKVLLVKSKKNKRNV